MSLPCQLCKETKAGGLPGPKHLRQLGLQSKIFFFSRIKEKKDEIVDKFSGSGNHSQQNNWKQDTQHDKQNDWNQNKPYDKDNHEKNTSKTAGQYGNQSGSQNFNKPTDK